jgi:AcrR family transcriptional regulator
MKLFINDEHLGAARTSTARTARSRRTRVALVAAVRDELRSVGAFTAETVAERADCSPATFYGHFATKDDALTAAFELVLVEMYELLRDSITIERIDSLDLEATITEFVERQATVFRTESLVFRTAISRLPAHKALRHLYREAERVSLEHLALVLGDEALAERFLVMSQGLNNPRALPADAQHVRSEFARSLTYMISRGLSV